MERVSRLDLNPKRVKTEHTMELLKAKSFLSVLLTITFLQCEMGSVHIYTHNCFSLELLADGWSWRLVGFAIATCFAMVMD